MCVCGGGLDQKATRDLRVASTTWYGLQEGATAAACVMSGLGGFGSREAERVALGAFGWSWVMRSGGSEMHDDKDRQRAFPGS